MILRHPGARVGLRGQGMLETGLVVGVIAILVVASLFLLTQWAGTTFNQQAETGRKDSEYATEMQKATGGATVNSTSAATSSSVTSTTSTSTSSTATTSTATTSTATTTTSTTSTATTTTTTTSSIADAEAPNVAITSPTTNQAVNGAHTITATITDNVSISSATFASVGADPTTPASGTMTNTGGNTYTASIDVPNGNFTHSVTITATDGVGNVGTGTINFK